MKLNLKYIAVILFTGSCITASRAQVSTRNATVKGNNQFAIALYKKLLKNNSKNLFVSPYSISSALAIAYAGAKGKTAQEMEKVLRISPKTIHKDYKKLNQHFKSVQSKELKLNILNALWGQHKFRFLSSYLQLNEQYYQAKIENLDFIEDTEGARLTINDWVEENTNKKIKDLLAPNVINKRTRLVITNVIYFKGSWATKFEASLTKKRTFTTPKQKVSDVDFLTMESSFRYAETNKFQALEIPYQGQKLSLMILLPKRINGLISLEKTLSEKTYNQILRNLRYENIKLSLPKFKINDKVTLKKKLISMGIRQAFSKKADFHKMTIQSRLKISDVIHKTFIEVDENGTEAAAATAVIGTLAEVSLSASVKVKYKIFKADHPFLFMIKDNKTNSILFIGKLNNPKITN